MLPYMFVSDDAEVLLPSAAICCHLLQPFTPSVRLESKCVQAFDLRNPMAAQQVLPRNELLAV